MNDDAKRKLVITIASILFVAIIGGWLALEWQGGSRDSSPLTDNFLTNVFNSDTSDLQKVLNKMNTVLASTTPTTTSTTTDPIKKYLEQRAKNTPTSTAPSVGTKSTTTNQ
jgi:hypothetical protein